MNPHPLESQINNQGHKSSFHAMKTPVDLGGQKI